MPLPLLTRHLEDLAAAGQLEIHPELAADARRAWNDWRAQHGRAPGVRFLTAPDANTKLSHGVARPTWSLSLAPASSSHAWNVCGSETSCARVCVGGDTCGRAAFDRSIAAGRILRTDFLGAQPAHAVNLVAAELAAATYRRDERGRIIGRRRIGARLNAFQDLRWERIAPDILTMPYVDPYDYTKHQPDERHTIGRYRLIYSVDEHDSRADIHRKAAHGPVAVAFDMNKHAALPASWAGMPVVDGDVDDWQNAQHAAGTVVALSLKGIEADRARQSGFARDPWTEPATDAPRGPRRRSLTALLAAAI